VFRIEFLEKLKFISSKKSRIDNEIITLSSPTASTTSSTIVIHIGDSTNDVDLASRVSNLSTRSIKRQRLMNNNEHQTASSSSKSTSTSKELCCPICLENLEEVIKVF
jgi:hypothetical protein